MQGTENQYIHGRRLQRLMRNKQSRHSVQPATARWLTVAWLTVGWLSVTKPFFSGRTSFVFFENINYTYRRNSEVGQVEWAWHETTADQWLSGARHVTLTSEWRKQCTRDCFHQLMRSAAEPWVAPDSVARSPVAVSVHRSKNHHHHLFAQSQQ